MPNRRFVRLMASVDSNVNMNRDNCSGLSFNNGKSRGKQCAAFGCYNFEYESDKTKSKLHFFKFPTKGPRKERWCNLIKRQDRRDGFVVNNNTRICEVHFRKEDIQRSLGGTRCRLKEGAEPSIFTWTTTSCKPKRKPPKLRKSGQLSNCYDCEIPCDNSHSSNQDVQQSGTSSNVMPISCEELSSDMCDADDSSLAVVNTCSNESMLQQTGEYPSYSSSTISKEPTEISSDSCGTDDPDLLHLTGGNSKLTEDKSTQTDFSDLSDDVCKGQSTIITCDHTYAFSFSFDNFEEQREAMRERLEVKEEMIVNLRAKVGKLEKEVKAYREQVFTLEKLKDDNAAILFYTGFPTYDTLIAFHEYLEPKVSKLQYWRNRNTPDSQLYQEDGKKKPGPGRRNSSLNELFMVLVRIRVGLFVQDISDRFGISKGHFSKIFCTWINFLFFELKLLFPFPSQSLMRKNMPEQFALYPTTRAIIDCSEIFVEVPSSMLAQSQTWSNYKHHNTFKVLVAISPNGQVIFVSKLWGGRVSDKHITASSGFLDHIDPGDNIMADRGFDIYDLLPPGVGLNIPPFKGSRDQLSAEEVSETVHIAAVRIHVERAIGRIKNYHILDGTLPLSLAHIADQLFTVCAYLTNLLPPLLAKASK